MIKRAAFALSLVVASMSFTASARAANSITSCTVNTVGWTAKNSSNVQQLWLTCTDGSTHIAYLNATNSACNTDINSLKMIESVATAAKLSGRALTVFWLAQSCQGSSNVRIIQAVELN
jgi:hypothetical protein